MAKTQVVNQTTTSTNVPEYARPYLEDALSKAQGYTNAPYIPYGYETSKTEVDPKTGQPLVVAKQGIDPRTGQEYGTRLAGFTDEQKQVQADVMGMQQRPEFGGASNFALMSGLGALDASQFKANDVTAPTYQQYQMQGPADVQAQGYQAAQMQGARSGYAPGLQSFLMGDTGEFGGAEASKYMSPYFQNVVDTQKREAITDAQKAQLTQNMGAARQGTYGGARQLLATTERERALGQQLGDIQARGTQSAYDNAQSQFERDRAARMQGQQTNVQSLNQTQGLGVQTGLQVALANLSNEQQQAVQNQAAQNQAMGMNAQQAMQAALANQQMGYNVGQQNLQSNLAVQQQQNAAQLAAAQGNQQAQIESARLGLAGATQLGQAGQTLLNIGQGAQQGDLQRMQAQANVGGQLQAQNQAGLDIAYGDFQRQQAYPMDQLNQYSGIIRGFDVKPNTTTTTYGQAPSTLSQVGGLGVGALSLYNMAKGA
jgi:hypothetical protein